jgi:hypothetical protein
LTVAWNEGAEPAVPRSEAQIKEREASGEVRVLKGTPDTDPMSFVVNCPSADQVDAGVAASPPLISNVSVNCVVTDASTGTEASNG